MFKSILFIIITFFILSCGDIIKEDSISEKDFYYGIDFDTCEKGFECNIQEYKFGFNSINECSEISDLLLCEENSGYKFNGVSAKTCLDCLNELSCSEFFQDDIDCPSCKNVCLKDKK